MIGVYDVHVIVGSQRVLVVGASDCLLQIEVHCLELGSWRPGKIRLLDEVLEGDKVNFDIFFLYLDLVQPFRVSF